MRASSALGPAEADAQRPELVLGTAGHIDHGKTALVRALTGVDTDRLPEERARGITIELGFAPLDLEGGLRLGVVDVPGHEALVRTMVAGASGIDLVLLVVAADEGVMPQTREHLAICELLGVCRGVVALTKQDLAGGGLAELAEADVAEALAATRLAGAPRVRCSAHTGEGLAALRAALLAAAREAPPRTPRAGPARLPVDRVFAARGFGAVVTGTLVGGALALGDAVEIHPGGLRARIRGLERHGREDASVPPGARCAVNLQGVSLAQLRRGMLLATPDAVAPTHVFDAEVDWLEVAPRCAKPLSLELLVGTAERRARLAPVGAPDLPPGSRGLARIHVEGEPLALLPGDRFVLRGFRRTAMGGTTVGGGRVLDAAPPHRRRSDPALRRELWLFAEGDVLAELRAGLAGARRERLRLESGLAPEPLAGALAALAARGEACQTAADRWLAPAALRELGARLARALDAYHAAQPLQPGMPAGALRGQLPANVPPDAAEAALAALVAAGEARVEGDRVRRPCHRPALAAEETGLAARILADADGAGLEPPPLREWSRRLGVDPEKLRDLLAHLEREGRLVRAGSELWFARAVVDALRERVLAHLRDHGQLTTQAYKALIGTSRRTAVPLMELFDDERVTLRRGDVRLPRRG
jgi:selenocysteine-specific elongation factor